MFLQFLSNFVAKNKTVSYVHSQDNGDAILSDENNPKNGHDTDNC